jgi:hypothetical protein
LFEEQELVTCSTAEFDAVLAILDLKDFNGDCNWFFSLLFLLAGFLLLVLLIVIEFSAQNNLYLVFLGINFYFVLLVLEVSNDFAENFIR